MGRITYEQKFKELGILKHLWEKIEFIVKEYNAKPKGVTLEDKYTNAAGHVM